MLSIGQSCHTGHRRSPRLSDRPPCRLSGEHRGRVVSATSGGVKNSPAFVLAFTTRLMNGMRAWPRAFGGESLGRNFSSSTLPIYEVCPCRAKLVVIGTSIIQYFDGVSGAAAQRSSKCVPAKLMCRQTLGRAHVPRPFFLLPP